MGTAKYRMFTKYLHMFDYIENLALAKVSAEHSKNQEEYEMFLPWSFLWHTDHCWSGNHIFWEVLLICDFSILDIGGI